ncbi:hypothetical protein BHM03_00037818, partial [Ensete ventricosum]
ASQGRHRPLHPCARLCPPARPLGASRVQQCLVRSAGLLFSTDKARTRQTDRQRLTNKQEMGASSSADHGGVSEQQQRQEEEENLAAATGFLPSLRNAFSNLSPPSSSSVPLASLQEALSLDVQVLASESTPVPEHFPSLLNNLGATLVSLFFPVADDRADGRIDWIGFLSGYNRCCGRMPVSRSINVLYRLYAALSREAGAPCGLELDPDSDDDDKVNGSLVPGEVLMLFWICWVMGHSSRIAKMSRNAEDPLVLPDMSHLLVSALVSCGVIAEDDERIWRSDVLAVDKGVSVQKFQTWVLTTAPGLANCLQKYVHERIQACSSSKVREIILNHSMNSGKQRSCLSA